MFITSFLYKFAVVFVIHTLALRPTVYGQLNTQRSCTVFSSPINPLIGSKLYDVTVVSSLYCQFACLSEESCTMVTYNLQSQTCSLFREGSTSYNVTDNILFVQQKQLAQSQLAGYQCPIQGQCLNFSSFPAPRYCCHCLQQSADLVCEPLLLSFQATRSSSSISSSSVVTFDSVPVNHWSFDQASNTFTAPVSGYYWLHMSVGIPSFTPANVKLQGAGRNIIIYRSTTNFNGSITTSADTVVYLTRGSTVYMSSQYPLYSDSLLQTSFGGFLLDSVMSEVVAFALGISSTFSLLNYIPFNITYIDTHNGWDASTKYYTAPVTGTYVFALNAGSTPAVKSSVSLFTTSDAVCLTLNFDTAHPGPDTYSSVAMVNLNAGDSARPILNAGTISSLTILSGLLYAPYLTQAVAFSVGQWAMIPSVLNNATDPVKFSQVYVNKGSGWNPTTNRFASPVGGIYYVHFTLMTLRNRLGNPCQVNLLLNGFDVITNAYMSSTQSDADSRGRGFILRLRDGDELRVRVANGLCFLNNMVFFTGFSGFLVHIM